jgi:multiple sugar transport system ATP-binding protein
MAEIEYRGLTKVFPDGTTAVDAVDLQIADGEFVVLVGPSGSGKTTVLRMTAGLEDVSDGEILIGSRNVNGIAPMDRDIAMVFQNYALYPHMNVYDNMAFGLKRHGRKKREIKPRVESTARMLGIDDLLKRKPSQLSGGQRQRVAMGRAIVRDPAAFLMDEPLSNLDAKLRVEMRSYVAMLHQRVRTTTIYVTHDQTEAMTMGTRVAVMRDGRLEQCDVPQRLYDRPSNMFVGAFIGSPAMNLVRSRLSAQNGDVFAELGDRNLRLPRRLLERRAGIREHIGGEVILGIRPEDIEDASLVPADGDACCDVRCSLAEAMGADVIAHFPLKARPVTALAAVAAALDDLEDARLFPETSGEQSPDEVRFTARLSPRCSAQTGERLKVAIDLERLHFFDAKTEDSIW